MIASASISTNNSEPNDFKFLPCFWNILRATPFIILVPFEPLEEYFFFKYNNLRFWKYSNLLNYGYYGYYYSYHFWIFTHCPWLCEEESVPRIFENTDVRILLLLNLCPKFVHLFSGLTNHRDRRKWNPTIS